MSSENSLSKRIKRHVIGRRRTYFVATSPGFEAICHRELSALGLSIENASVVEGGIEFDGRLQDCYQANLHLRTANRILLRIDQFKAAGFRQLESKVAGIPWELYLPPTVLPDIHVTTKHCRLYHTAAIGQRFLAGISNHLSNGNFGREEISLPLADTTIFVRGVDDRFTISIDSSGDNLHKRGLKRHHGKAPLRETIAAAALLLAGYSGTEPLIDPMCGTGTFSLEAALMVKNVPPGWYRKFAFMEWPSFRRKQWEYLKRLCEKEFVRPEAPLVFASDKDPAACRKFQKCVREFGLTDTITVFEKTFFELEPEEMTDRLGLIAINPPYGRRFGTLQESAKLFQTICARLQQVFKGWKLVLIAPSTQLADKIPFKLEAHIFRHGGLKLTLMVGKIT